jgi:hypothetical protein
METVMKIYRQPEDNQRFIPPVTILNIHRLQQEIPVNISPSAKEK